MHLVIDTYNVLHVVGILPPEIAGIDTADLIDLLRRSRYRGRRAILVCDGVPGPGAPQGRGGSISVRYAGPGRTADDRIAAIIRGSSAPRRLTIVSSDLAIIREARRRRCATLDSADFLRQLADDHPHGGPDPAPAATSPDPIVSGNSTPPSVLPPELIAEAEMLAELEPELPVATVPPEAPEGPEAPEARERPPASEPHPPGLPDPRALSLDDLDLADLAETGDHDATIPRDILDEAEALWRTGAGESPPPPPPPPREPPDAPDAPKPDEEAP